ncbi:MAG: hypothetical protein M3003_07385 [Candidatus Dormibacteraeota bacterium]|nr:hypothetical protein [Candidatus Dormibacteraeota bacterium]
MSSAGWYSIGRTFAFVYAAGWFAGTWIFTLVSFAIISPPPPDAADRVAHYAYERAVYPQLYVAVVCLVAAMLCLIGLGIVLRHSLGPDGARQQLMAAGFGAAGLFGVLWLFLTLGLLQAVVNVSQGASSETLRTLTDASALIESPANWLQRAFLLLAGLGTYWSSRLALEQGSFPRVWAYLGFVLTALYWLGLFSLLARDGAVPVPDAIGGLVILLSGGIVAPVWGVWLAVRLRKAPAET